jgi:hypothetical protein
LSFAGVAVRSEDLPQYHPAGEERAQLQQNEAIDASLRDAEDIVDPVFRGINELMQDISQRRETLAD